MKKRSKEQGMEHMKPNSITENFGKNLFSEEVMKERLPKDVYRKLKKTIEEGNELDRSIADVVANAMKNWAMEHGATHFTHWFQPLTGITAEKHDSFIAGVEQNGQAILHFSGKELIKGEADASSFPSGGLRATFEARGYTAWDCTSPAFLREDAIGVTLCIPTAFCSYTGEALDKKTPLLRSMEAVSEQALRFLRLFGNTTARRVVPQVGPEQEYFLVDKEKYLKRKDLIYTGRTLFGAMPPKGQEMDDHYFGSIRERIGSFMNEINIELWKLGVTAKTQHNEAAPAQHELAPIYTQANLAVDQNQMVMDVLKKVADRHGLKCLLHEKPFRGVNGSGKHVNWSLLSDDGVNLLSTGDTPEENIRFLLVLACMLRAVDEHADLLRYSAADVGNDQRLGGGEAPPAIISVYIGQELENVLERLTETGDAGKLAKKGERINTSVRTLPDFEMDTADRNRTSPFAFTGNKFEFRMVGSSDSTSSPNVILNTIAAEALADVCDRLEKIQDQEEFDLAVHDLIREMLSEHKRIVFNGNGYSEEWVEEAARRGLPNISCMVEAVPALTTEKSVRLFERFHVLSKKELESRAEVEYETYAKAVNIEAKAMLDIAGKDIIPSVMAYIGALSGTVKSMQDASDCLIRAGVSAYPLSQRAEAKRLSACAKLLDEMQDALEHLEIVRAEVRGIGNLKQRAEQMRERVVPAMEALRLPADRLEMIVDRRYWCMPSYGDLLFEV